MANLDGAWGTGSGYVNGEPEGVESFSGDQRAESAKPQLSHLLSTLESEIIPRLMLVHAAPRAGSDSESHVNGRGEIDAADVVAFTNALLSTDATAAPSLLSQLHARGVTTEAVFLRLLAPSARRLGRLWESDRCSFVDVTLALCRMHQLLRELSPRFRIPDRARAAGGRHALLLPAPNEQHMFGVLMVAEFFRRAGWDVSRGPAEPLEVVTRIVEQRWVDLVGLSASTDRAVQAMPETIRALRGASCNQRVAVLVGGRAFCGQPELARRVGADGTGDDAVSATLHAENLFAMIG